MALTMLLLFSRSVVSDSLWPMDCSMSGFPVLHYLTQFIQIQTTESVMPSSNLILYCPLFLQPSIFRSIKVFSTESALPSHDQSIGASATVLIMNTQNWFPLGLTGLISLPSKGISRVFSNTTVQKHQFFDAQLSLWSTLTSIHD